MERIQTGRGENTEDIAADAISHTTNVRYVIGRHQQLASSREQPDDLSIECGWDVACMVRRADD